MIDDVLEKELGFVSFIVTMGLVCFVSFCLFVCLVFVFVCLFCLCLGVPFLLYQLLCVLMSCCLCTDGTQKEASVLLTDRLLFHFDHRSSVLSHR